MIYTIQGVRNQFQKQEMELFKQEMELFLLFRGLQSKNFLNKVWSTQFKYSETGFRNRKWNYWNRKWNYWNRKWNYFSYLQAFNQKTSLTKYDLYNLRSQKPVSETGNGILKQEMELFILLIGLQSKNVFNKVWSI